MASHKQFQLPAPGKALEAHTVPTPEPGPGEVLISVTAVAINPLEVVQQKFGVLLEKWPAVLGVEASGVVKAVGEDVTDYSTGDPVLVFAEDKSYIKPGGGTFQTAFTIPQDQVAHAPKSVPLADAAALPVAFLTGASAVYSHPGGLGQPLNFLEDGDKVRHHDIKSVLVLGGSSGVGNTAIQLLRESLGPKALILTTSSPAHHESLKARGANAAFDRKSATLIDDVKQATSGGRGVDAIFDAVGVLAVSQDVLAVLRADGPRIAAVEVTSPPPTLPADVMNISTGAIDVFKRPGGGRAQPGGLMGQLDKILSNGTYRVPFTVVHAGSRFEDLPAALERLDTQGVSGQRLIVRFDE